MACVARVSVRPFATACARVFGDPPLCLELRDLQSGGEDAQGWFVPIDTAKNSVFQRNN